MAKEKVRNTDGMGNQHCTVPMMRLLGERFAEPQVSVTLDGSGGTRQVGSGDCDLRSNIAIALILRARCVTCRARSAICMAASRFARCFR